MVDRLMVRSVWRSFCSCRNRAGSPAAPATHKNNEHRVADHRPLSTDSRLVALPQFESVEVVGWARYKWSATVSCNRLCQRHIVPAAALLAI